MKYTTLLLCAILFLSCQSTTTEAEDKAAILSVINQQEQAWNNYDLEGFMEGYWKSEALKFYGVKGITSGWEKTLANYKKSYPSKEHTGQLNFKINNISRVDEASYYVMGEYHLVRTVGNADGIFMIVFKKINGDWKIIADTSC